MSATSEMTDDLREHLELTRELLTLVERESQHLRKGEGLAASDTFQSKKILLPRLVLTLDKLRRHRARWQNMNPADRVQHPEIGALLRQNQDQIMKIIMMDRENEQCLLRRGMIPARELPSVSRQRPHYVADLYRRQSAGSPREAE